ncbi:hypothetical protein BDZ45DRAFT_749849 [Acephala macrosclerotiorum]|nr:hypothetical protein BDZ45DRAFT_749849 [Acephala macrosclerotiorum]
MASALLNSCPRDGRDAFRVLHFDSSSSQLQWTRKLANNAFAIRETSSADVDDMAHMFIICNANDDIWKPMTSRISSDDRLEWMRNYFRNQAAKPDMRSFKVVESATGKIIAFANLQYPYTYTPEDNATMLSRPQLQWPLGFNTALAFEFPETCLSEACGYDPSKHFHRQGTNTHPSHQRKGLGTMLSLRCNEIADKAGAKTYVVSRPNSLRMLQKTGFKTLATNHIDMTRHGGSKEDGKMWVLMREPMGNGPDALQEPGEKERHVPSIANLLEAKEEQRWKDAMSSNVYQGYTPSSPSNETLMLNTCFSDSRKPGASRNELKHENREDIPCSTRRKPLDSFAANPFARAS